MKIAKLNIEGYIGDLDLESKIKEEKNFSLNDLDLFLNNLGSDVTDIEYTVNSGGGEVFVGWEMRRKLLASGKKLHAIGENIVGSIATVVYMAAKLENREIVKGTEFFIHHPYWMPGEAEPIRASELLALGSSLKEQQDKLLNFYALESKASAEQLYPLMAKETSLSSSDAVLFGFAGKEIDKEEFVDYHKYRLVAMIDIKDKSNKQINKMEEQNNAVLSAIEKFGTMLNKFMKGKTLNMKIQATNSEGEQVELVVDGEGEAIVGAPAFTVDVNGEQMPAMDGSYTDTDGKTFVVVEGKIAEIIEANKPEPIEAIKAELETVKAQLVEKESMLQASITEKESIKASLDGINTEFVALKATVIGASAKFEKGAQEFNNQKQQETSHNSEFINQIKNSLTKK